MSPGSQRRSDPGPGPQGRYSVRSLLAIAATATLLSVTGLLLLGGLAADPAAAQTNNSTEIGQVAGYYNETNISGVGDSWWAKMDPSDPVGTTIELGQRFPSFVGVGEQDSSGTGFQGTLLTGLLMVGIGVGAVSRTGIGEVGGTILSVVVGYVLTDFGLAPVWLKPLLVLPIALLAAIAFIRATR